MWDRFKSVLPTEATVGKKGYALLKALPYIAIGAGAAAYAVPTALTAVGFTSSGIAAKSMAAYMMKVSAIHCGGSIPAGGVIATLQSCGATAGASYLSGVTVGGSIWYKLVGSKKDDEKTETDEDKTKKD